MDVFVVTGAPGSGKSTSLQFLLQQESRGFVFFDGDDLFSSVNELCGGDVCHEESKWKPFRGLWLSILELVAKNTGKTGVLFLPLDKEDTEPFLEKYNFHFCLLHVDDSTRRIRLEQRNYTEDQIQEAIQDAHILKDQLQQDTVIDTTKNNPQQVARAITNWLVDA